MTEHSLNFSFFSYYTFASITASKFVSVLRLRMKKQGKAWVTTHMQGMFSK